MRRRSTLGINGGKLIFCNSSGTPLNQPYSVSSVSYATVYLRYNDEEITDDNVTLSSSETWARPVWNSSNKCVYITLDSNCSANIITATITASYKSSSASLEIMKGAAYVYFSWISNPVDSNEEGASARGSRSGCNAGYIGSDYTVTSNQSWTTNMYAGGSGYVYVTCSGNPTTSSRSAKITVTQNGTGITGSFTITQPSARVITMPLPYDGIIDGHKYITINGVKWAVNNVGASSDGAYGNYYQWGAGSTTYSAGATDYDSTHVGDGTYILPSSNDTATQVMGGGWRMPTKAEIQSLFSATNEWVKYSSGGRYKYGRIFVDSSDSNKYLFIPAGGSYNDSGKNSEEVLGYIWSSLSSTSTNYNGWAWYGVTRSNYANINNSTPRKYGHTVRGIHD